MSIKEIETPNIDFHLWLSGWGFVDVKSFANFMGMTDPAKVAQTYTVKGTLAGCEHEYWGTADDALRYFHAIYKGAK
jgi:hypothetical protein